MVFGVMNLDKKWHLDYTDVVLHQFHNICNHLIKISPQFPFKSIQVIRVFVNLAMGEIDTKPIESVQTAITFFGQTQTNELRKNNPTNHNVSYQDSIFLRVCD